MKKVLLIGTTLLLFLLAACGTAAPAQPVTPVSPVKTTPLPGVLAIQNTNLKTNADTSIRFTQISIEAGLSQSVVNCILQDRQGFLWVGTQDGLNRYDGFDFKIYKPDPGNPDSISDAWITSLYEDKDGYLWIGTSQAGLNKYDPKSGKFTRFLHNPKDPGSLTAGSVQAILQDSAGDLWVATEYGLNRFNFAQSKFQRYVHDPTDSGSLSDNNVHALLEDKKGNLWVGTNAGLDRFNSAVNTFWSYTKDADNPNSLSDSMVMSLAEDKTGNLWVGTSYGLNQFEVEKNRFWHFLNQKLDANSLGDNTINALRFDSRGLLWVGTDNGIDRFDTATQIFRHDRHSPLVQTSLSANLIYAIYEDREGLIWVGTWGGGLNKYNPALDKFGLYRYDPTQLNSLNDSAIFGIYSDNPEKVWIGTYEGGLELLDPLTGKTSDYQNDPQNPDSLNSSIVWMIYRDRQGTLWVGTSNGLDQFDEQHGKFIHHTVEKDNPDSLSGAVVHAIYEDSAGELWVGTGKGLDRYDRVSEKFIHYTSPNPDDGKTPRGVGYIYEDSSKNLWVATLGYGLYRLDRQTGSFQHFQRDAEDINSLASDFVLFIHEDQQGKLWFATGGGGISKYDPNNNTFKTYTERQGLSNNFVYCIIEDNQKTFWLSTNYGVSHFDPAAETFQNYTISDGLQSNEFNQGACAQAQDGSIYFGGVNGLTHFFPSDIRPSTYTPAVALTSLTQNGKPVAQASTVENIQNITLRWPENSFEFQFTSLSLAEPKKNQFAYELEKFDNDWVMIGNQHSGRYTNLPGGTYTLRLKASNNDGLWSNTGKAVTITIIPPFWQTWWFYLLAGLTVVAGVIGASRLRVHRIESQKLELQRQVTERTREIEKLFEQTKELAIIEERNRLARDLHDSAKQKAFAALAQIGTANGMINTNVRVAKEHLGEAENLVSDVIQELTFLIQEMYPLALKEKGLATSLREYAFDWENRSDIPVCVKIEGAHRLKLEVEQALYRIVQESLANIARHSQASSATLNVHYNETHIQIEIIDDGRGFVPKNATKGIGLRLIRERAESVGGQVSIESEPGHGTRVLIDIPVENEILILGETNV